MRMRVSRARLPLAGAAILVVLAVISLLVLDLGGGSVDSSDIAVIQIGRTPDQGGGIGDPGGLGPGSSPSTGQGPRGGGQNASTTTTIGPGGAETTTTGSTVRETVHGGPRTSAGSSTTTSDGGVGGGSGGASSTGTTGRR
jgi:hypothetical protein